MLHAATYIYFKGRVIHNDIHYTSRDVSYAAMNSWIYMSPMDLRTRDIVGVRTYITKTYNIVE